MSLLPYLTFSFSARISLCYSSHSAETILLQTYTLWRNSPDLGGRSRRRRGDPNRHMYIASQIIFIHDSRIIRGQIHRPFVVSIPTLWASFIHL